MTDVGDYVSQLPTPLPWMVVAAVDFEPKFSNYDDTPTPGVTITPNSPRAWATAFSGTDASVYYDFGSTDGYPAPRPTPTDPVPPVPHVGLNSPWRVDQLYEISFGIPQARALPEIYQIQMARPWYAVKRWAVEHSLTMSFSGVTSGCGDYNCNSPYYNWTQAWQVFWLELNADERPFFQQVLTYETDIWPTLQREAP